MTPEDIHQCLKMFLIFTTGLRGLILEFRRWRPGMLLNILQCTEQLLTMKNCMAQDVNSDKVENFTLSFRCCIPHVSGFLMCLGFKEGLLHCSSFSSNRRQLLLVNSGLLFWGCMVGWCLCCFGPLSVLAQLYVLSLHLGLSQ